MFSKIYIEALLVDEDLADQVWEAWNGGELCDVAACVAWLSMVCMSSSNPQGQMNGRPIDSRTRNLLT